MFPRAASALLLVALLPSPRAQADEVPVAAPTAPAEAAPPFGRVEVVRDRRAGLLERVTRVSSQVTIVRAGQELPISPGALLAPGDALRTDLGTVLVERQDDVRLWLGERSQVRLEGDLLFRLGELAWDAAGPLRIVGEGFVVEVSGGRGRLRWYRGQGGEIVIHAGEVTWVQGDRRVLLGAGNGLSLSSEGGSVPLVPSPESATALDAVFAAPPPGGEPVRDPGRLVLRVGGGIALAAGAAWMHPAIDLRIRLGGPLWMGGGAGLLVRSVDDVPGAQAAFVLPVQGGVRLHAELPRSIVIRGGVDGMALLGARCIDWNPCARRTAAEPGVRLGLGLGLWMAPRIGLEVDLTFGLHRRTLPPYPGTTDPIVEPAPWFSLQVGFLFGR